MQFNLIYFLRLFSKHILIILGVPIILATAVYFLTKGEPRTYTSQTTVYTSFASGSSLDLSTMKINSVNTAFDNLIGTIKSRETLEEVGLKLFAEHLLLDKADPFIILPEHYQIFIKSLPNDIKQLKVPNNFDQTFNNIKKYREKSPGNYIDNLIQKGHPYYGSSSILGNLSVKRLQTSDNIGLSFESNDPGICQHTLILLTESFKKNYLLLKAGESSNAVAYYEAEVAKAAEKLRISEDELLKFNQENQIINYSEQSKFIAARKEAFESGYQEVLKQNSSAKAVLELLEQKMSPYEKKRISGANLMDLREKLASVNQELALESFFNTTSDTEQKSVQSKKFNELTQKAFELKQQMHSAIDSLYNLSNSSEGIPSNNILTDWLNNVIDYEGTKAQIVTLDQLRTDFDKIYSRFAPMGATMRRLERKINVNEDEYITLLKNLGLAKLKQQGLVSTSGFSIIDDPYFPTSPQPDKRKIMIIAAGIIGFVLTLFIILIIDLLDPSLRNAFRAKMNTKLEVAALFPKIPANRKKKDILQIEQQSLDNIVRRILLDAKTDQEKSKQKRIAIFSTRAKEGKTYLITRIFDHFQKLNITSTLLVPENTSIKDYNFDHFSINESYITAKRLEDICSLDSMDHLKESQYVFVEMPAFIINSYPVELLRSFDLCYLVCRANRSWASYDGRIIEEVQTLRSNSPVKLFLNGVDLVEMESVLGELPKKRSWIRRLIKGLITHQSRTKSVV